MQAILAGHGHHVELEGGGVLWVALGAVVQRVARGRLLLVLRVQRLLQVLWGRQQGQLSELGSRVHS